MLKVTLQASISATRADCMKTDPSLNSLLMNGIFLFLSTQVAEGIVSKKHTVSFLSSSPQKKKIFLRGILSQKIHRIDQASKV